MRVASVLLLLVLIAGCVAPATQVQTASTALPPPAVKADGATLTMVDGGVLVSWTGKVVPSNLPVSIPLPQASNAVFHALSLPADATLLHGWLNWTATDATLRFSVLNESGRSWCGGVMAENQKTECFATLYAKREKALDWKVRVAGTTDAAQPEPVEYAMTLLVGNAPLPMLGSPAPFGKDAPLQFGSAHMVAPDAHTAEPSIAVTPKGTIYVAAPLDALRALWRSTDDGQTFAEVPIRGQPTDPLSSYPVGGGDADVATSGEDAVYFADQHLAETVAASHDGGKTFFTQPLGSGAPLTDRQWLVTDGPMTAWLAFNSLMGATVSQTRDGGHTWAALGTMREDSCFRGNLARAIDGTLYFAGCDDKGPGVGVSTDGGLTFAWHPVAHREGKTNTSFLFPAHIFVVATTDQAGNVYVVWSDEAQEPDATGAPQGGIQGLNVWLASSKDKGATWSKPKKVNHNPGTYVLPWATGGADGHVAVAYYGTKFAGHPERALGEWYPIVAVSADATSDDATFAEAAASDQPNQYGPVCMRGSGCGNARNLLDFFQIQADAAGRIHMAFVDGTAGGTYDDAKIMYVGQRGGLLLGGRSVDKDGIADGSASALVSFTAPSWTGLGR